MSFKKYALLILAFSSIAGIGQIAYDNLPLPQKIAYKQGNSSFLLSNMKGGSGGGPSILTTGPEQDCNSAIPVCQNIYSTTTSYSGNGNTQEIPNNSCLGSNELNSVWYTFTSNTAGNIAFNITPNVSSQDYDFALYDITGNNCSSISSGALTPIRCNFSATGGVTGLSPSGTNPSEPSSGPNQSSVLPTTVGHTYVLIISNYSSSSNGYQLNFTPGTASIFDVTPPTLTSVSAPCGSNILTLNTSEQVTCASIASNGSDLSLTGTGGPYTIAGASGVNCGASAAQITFTVNPALTGGGPWTLNVNNGSDGNTLIDNCGNAMAPTSIVFTISPATGTITGPSNVCKGSTFALSVNSAISYTWTGSAVPAGQQNNQSITITANSLTTMNLTCVLNFGTCGTATVTKAVTVTDAPVANFSALPSLTVCAGNPITFTNTTTYPCSTGGLGINVCTCGSFLCSATSNQGTFATYLWNFGDGGTAFYIGGSPASNFSPSHTYSSPGTYIVSLNASGLINTCSSTQNLTVTVLPAAANVTVSPSVTICPSQATTLTAQGGSSYTWTPGATLNTTNGGTVIATTSVTQIYTVASPGCGGTQTNTIQVTVNNTPPAIGAINGATAICSNQTGVTYSVSNVASTNYTWSVPAGASITSLPTNSNVITVSFGSTVGTVSVQAVSACGNATALVNVVLTPNLNLIITPSNPTVCAGGASTLTASGASSYTWSPAASLSSANGSTVSASPLATTIYTINGASGTCTGVATATVTFSSGLTLSVTPSSPTICPSSSVTLTASGATTYTWNNASTLSSANGAIVSANPLTTTTYTINGSDALGCSGTTTIAVNVSSPVTLTITPSATICPGISTTLSVVGANSYTWSPAGSLSAANGGTVVASPVVNTTYTVAGTTLAGCIETATTSVFMGGSLTVNVSPNATVCPLSPHTFSASGATNYTWTPSAFLNTSTSGTVISTPSITTTYTVDGATGTCLGSNTVTIVVANTVVVNAATTSSSVCPLGSSSLTATGANSYVWSPGITLSGTTGSLVIASPVSSTTYTVIGSSGTCTNSTQVAIVVLPVTPLSISPNASICAGGSATLSVSGSNTYTWSPGADLNTVNGSNVIANPTTSIIYTVNGTSTGGCTNFTIVSVNVTPIPNITITSTPSTVCFGDKTVLSAFGSLTNSYAWSPTGSLSSPTGPVVTASPTNSIIYTVIGSNGVAPVCNSSQTIAINVIPKITVTTASTQPICFGNTTLLEAHGGNTYSWTPSSDITNASDSITFVKPTSTKIYSVIVSNNGLCPQVGTVQVTVYALPYVYAGKDTIINIDEVLVLHGASNVPNNLFGFLAPANETLDCNFCPKVTVHPLNNTCYILQAETPVTKCRNWDTVCVKVTKDWDIFFPNAFSPNGDLDNEYFMPKGFGLAKINMVIFDRWGVQIFKENETTLGWDGKYKGKLCQEDVYVYQIEATSLGGSKVRKTGHVALFSKAKVTD